MARMTGQRITNLRARWAPQVATGLVRCRRCHQPIDPTQDWDMGHAHDLALGGHPRGPMAPEHARKADCPEGGNRAAGARLGNQLRHRPRRNIGEWLK